VPIELRTGLPGAGKSLGLVEHLLHLRQAESHRPVRALGVTGLRDDLADALTPEQFQNWHELPAGTIVVVDEAQKYLPARRTGEPPEWIRKLSEHRHLGLDFIFVTQHPALLDTYVRRLVDRHIHTVRKYGTSIIERLSWPEVQMEPTSKAAVKAAERKSRHTFSKQAMQCYTSAELHTVKRKIPPFLIFGMCLLVIVPLLAFAGYQIMHRASDPKRFGGTAFSKKDVALVPASSSSSGKQMTAAEWVQRQTPRVKGVPWSAPIFDSQQVVTVPDLRCIIIDDADARHCHCYSEQDTRVDVATSECFQAATDGVYNPYRQPMQSPSDGPAKASSAQGPAPDAKSVVDAGGDGSGASGAWKQGVGTDYSPPGYVARDMTPLKSGTGM
jgi:zona occludens toxin